MNLETKNLWILTEERPKKHVLHRSGASYNTNTK